MMLAHLALRQLEAYMPFLQSGEVTEPESLYAALLGWIVKFVVFGLLTSVFRSRYGSPSGGGGMWDTYRSWILPTTHVQSGGADRWIAGYCISLRLQKLKISFEIGSLKNWYWNRDLIDDFNFAALEMYNHKTDKEIHIYNHSPHGDYWSAPMRRPTRAWDSVILPATVKEKVLADVERFISPEGKAWYSSKGIPHRRGYLLHGPPGAGKTTLAAAVASKLRLNLYCVSPAAAGMDNSKLERYFQTCPPGSLLFIEDIDCVMPVKRSGNQSGSKAIGTGAQALKLNGKNEPGPSSVTLSGLLNAIDGVASQEDSVLFAPTNFPDSLDGALRRPGRFDVDIAFDYTTHEQAVGIFEHFYILSGPLRLRKQDVFRYPSLERKVRCHQSG